MRLLIASAVLAIHCCSASCYGVLIQDQSNTATTATVNHQLVPNATNTAAQVVTTGVSGQLFKIELGVDRILGLPDEPLYVDITSTVGQLPDFSPSARLATRTIMHADVPPQGSLPAFSLSVDFSADDLDFLQGEQFAIVLRSNQPVFGYGWWINANLASTYAGGSAYSIHIPTNALQELGDSHFRTFMNIPEPAIAAVTGMSLVGLVATRRRRKRMGCSFPNN